MIESIPDFIKYFEGIRKRTLNYTRVLPLDRLDWAPKEGEFTCGDILRHFIASEQMFVGVVLENRWKYPGHENDGDQSLDNLLARMEAVHAEMMSKLEQLPGPALNEARLSPEGHPVKAWRWLMVMAEHEIHHRSQLAVYQSLMGVQPPHIFGLGVEELIALSVT
jgi:uncharacterized damage-inducible protein DinB